MIPYNLKVVKLTSSLSLLSCLAFLTLTLSQQGCRSWGGDLPNPVELAKQAQSKGETDTAVRIYQEHMLRRLKAKNRPEDENPYFYQVLISDVYRSAGRLEDAYQNIIEAEQHGVDKELILDRIRLIAGAYEEKKNYEQAIKILDLYRPMDPLLIDLDIDRIYKESLGGE